MFRKTFLMDAALVLGALVVVMMLGGCAQNTPPPTAKPYCSAPESTEYYVWTALSDYLGSHFPEQPLRSFERTGDTKCSQSPCLVVVTNKQTGFRWEGNMWWHSKQNEGCYGYTIVVDTIKQISVMLPSQPGITPSPTP